MNWETVYQGLEASAYGLAGVFAVLILFYLLVKLMLAVSRKAEKRKSQDGV